MEISYRTCALLELTFIFTTKIAFSDFVAPWDIVFHMHILLKFYPYLDLKLDIEIHVNVVAGKTLLFMQQNMDLWNVLF